MADQWFIKKGNNIVGPLTSAKIKTMVEQEYIVADTPIAREKEGPFSVASKVKGLMKPKASNSNNEEQVSEYDGLEDYFATAERSRKLPIHQDLYEEPKQPMLSLWTLAVGAGLLSASLVYATAWRFSSPVWAYGTFMMPVGVSLLIVSWYAFRKSPRALLSRNSFYVNLAFGMLTIFAGLGTIYDMWTLEKRIQNNTREMFRRADSAIGN